MFEWFSLMGNVKIEEEPFGSYRPPVADLGVTSTVSDPFSDRRPDTSFYIIPSKTTQ